MLWRDGEKRKMATGDFTLTCPRKIVFGWGASARAPSEILACGRRVLVISGASAAAARETLCAALLREGAEVASAAGPGREPEVEDVDRLVAEARARRPDVVVGLGGGSVLDCAKAVAAVLPNCEAGGTADFLEGTGATRALVKAPLPFVALPTTAGTGSEASKNAVISWRERSLKRSIRDERMLAATAIVDPALGTGVPPGVTAASGMDAITQLIESYVARGANPLTDALCESALPRAFAALPAAHANGGDREARTDMAYAALVSGICLANAGLGVVHGIAPALGIVYGVAHGAACAALLPFALEVNRVAAREKLAKVWGMLGREAAHDADEGVARLIAHVEALSAQLGIATRLRAYGVAAERIGELLAFASGNSLKSNPRQFAPGELAELLAARV